MKYILIVLVVFLLAACDNPGQKEEETELTTEELLTLGPWHRDLDGDIMPINNDSAWVRIEFTADGVSYYNAPNLLASVGTWTVSETVTCGIFAELVSKDSDIGLPGVDPLGNCPVIHVTVPETLPVDVVIFELTNSRMRFAGFLIDRINPPSESLTYPIYALTYMR